MGDFFAFRRMVTPVIIQIIFWIGVLFCVIVGIMMVVSTAFFQGQLLGALLLIAGPLIVRVYCEIFIVAFKINDSLTDIRSHVLTTRAEPRT
jgi:hypothetical protein